MLHLDYAIVEFEAVHVILVIKSGLHQRSSFRSDIDLLFNHFLNVLGGIRFMTNLRCSGLWLHRQSVSSLYAPNPGFLIMSNG